MYKALSLYYERPLYPNIARLFSQFNYLTHLICEFPQMHAEEGR